MALKSGRTGVRNDQVNIDGLPIASTFFNALVNDLPTWTDLPSYKNGTEQLLPVNDDEPETSPILCDIQYPDSLRNDQYFTYRESPTTKDGLAKIRGIRGNTLVWNQRCRTLESGNWGTVSIGTGSLTFSDGVATFSTTVNYGRFLYTPGDLVSGHKYLLSVEIKGYANAVIDYGLGTQTTFANQGCYMHTGLIADTNWHRYLKVGTFTSGTDDKVLVENVSGAENLGEIQVRNIMYFDLTQMGLDVTENEFVSLFPLSMYTRDLGSLLFFTGTGIKVTGRNILQLQPSIAGTFSNGVVVTQSGGVYTLNGTATGYGQGISDTSFVLNPGTYTIKKNPSSDNNNVQFQIRDLGGTKIFANAAASVPITFTLTEVTEVKVRLVITSAVTLTNFTISPQLEIGSVASDFEPYHESTLSLPISTYFPTGMKSAGSVYDELIPTKAITRVGTIVFDGSNDEVWVHPSDTNRFYIEVSDIATSTPDNTVGNIKSNKYIPSSYSLGSSTDDAITTRYNIKQINVFDSTYSTIEDFRTALASNPLVVNYELATPVVEATMSFE